MTADASGGSVEIVARPERSRLLMRGLAKVLQGTDYVLETRDGERVGEIRLRLARPNEYVPAGATEPLLLGQTGVLSPRFELRERDGRVRFAIAYDLLTGAMRLRAPDGRDRPLERRGLLLPETILRDADGGVALEVASARLHGREHRVRLRPSAEWSRPDLLAIAALALHAEMSLALVFRAALGAGVLAPARARAATR